MRTNFTPRLLCTFALAFALFASMPVPAHAVVCAAAMQPCNGGCIPERNLCILEPLPGGPSDLPPLPGIGIFFYYINNGVWQWAFKVGIAIAVLQGTFAGFQIVTSNGDSGAIENAKQKFLWASLGLVMLLLSGVILAFINPIGFATP